LIPDFQMVLQRKMPGIPATGLLAGAEGTALARRIAEAAHKLHQAGIPVERTHTISDEMDILSTRLVEVARLRPAWEGRLERLLEACGELSASIPAPEPTGIHRDFYADQVLVDNDRLYIVDLDLYCMGDPALDIGNFTGHITEFSLRSLGNPAALRAQEQALEDRFAELAGEPVRARVRAYAALTLARHISISTRLPERQPYTERILGLCEFYLQSASKHIS
jgi:aminoglycoside phosphotransferase (APT) family kinase protein